MWHPLDTSGYEALEMWLVQMEMCSKNKYTPDFENNTKKEHKIFH